MQGAFGALQMKGVYEMANEIKYCRKCGTQAEINAKFCRNCGCQFTTGQQAGKTAPGEPARMSEKYVSQSRVHIPEEYAKKNEAKTRQSQGGGGKGSAGRKKSWKGVVAVVVAAAVFAVTAFKYPGFLLKKDEPGGLSSLYSAVTGEGKADKAAEEDSETDVLAVFDNTEQVNISWSEKELAEAAAVEEPVASDTAEVSCGEVKADFGGFTLPGKDRLIVKELPEKEDKNKGVTSRAYDFSLASGQAQFPVYVDLYIPRESAEEVGICEYYNEDSSKWEEVNYDISNDGSAYVIHTKHFSLYRKLRLNEKALAKIKEKNLKASDLEDEDIYNWMVSFREYRKAGDDKYEYDPKYYKYGTEKDYMLMPVEFIGQSGLSSAAEINWDEYYQLTKKLCEAAEAERKDSTQVNPLWGTILGYIGVGSDSGSFLNVIPDTPKWKGAGVLLYALSLLTTISQLYNDMSQGRGFWDFAWNHLMDGATLTVGAIGTVMAFYSGPAAAVTGVVCAGASLLLYGGSLLYNEGAKRDLSVPEQLYRDYYSSPLVGQRVFFFEGEAKHDISGPGTLPRLSVMEEADYQTLKSTVNEVCGGLKAPNPSEGRKNPAFEQPDYSWAVTISKLYELYEKKPEKLREAVMALYEAYARAYWEMGAEYNRAFSMQDMQNRSFENAKYEAVSDTVKEEYVANMVADMIGSHSSLYSTLAREYIDKAQAPLYKVLDEEVVPMLNATMTFRLLDGAADPEVKSLKDSEYYKALRDIPENKEEFSDDPEAYADFNNAVSPLRFAVEKDGGRYELVREPWFIPAYLEQKYEETGYKRLELVERLKRGDATWYYPFNEGFIPQFQGGDNIIFRCTFYHYLMMGAPTVLVLHDPSEKISDIALHFELPEPEKDGSYNVVIGAEGLTIHDFAGDWRTTVGGKDTIVRIDADGYRQEIWIKVIQPDYSSSSVKIDSSDFKFDPKSKSLRLLPADGSDSYSTVLDEEISFYYRDKDHLTMYSSSTGEVSLRRTGEDEDDYLDW